jgi:ribosomal protein S18 acetylase RimI-like enzyme
MWGYPDVMLEVHKDNKAALDFYERLGFRECKSMYEAVYSSIHTNIKKRTYIHTCMY